MEEMHLQFRVVFNLLIPLLPNLSCEIFENAIIIIF
jgi:hypothetical protein